MTRFAPFALLLACVIACSPARTVVRSDEATADAEPTTSARQAPPPTAPPAPVPQALTTEQHGTGQTFDREVRLLFRIAACAGDEPVPAPLETTVAAHCAQLAPLVERYRSQYLEQARPFLTALQPEDVPKTVVYPFGGGDLLSALSTYPQATLITTLSLEHAGDPRRISDVDAETLSASLRQLRTDVSGLLTQSDSTSDNLMDTQRGDIPGQLAFFLIGLAIHDQQPVGLRYFRVEPDGSLHYLEADDITAIEDELAKRLNAHWKSPDFSAAFSNMELTFRSNSTPDAPVRVHRHIAANLMDGPLAADPRVIRHLESYGRVAAMTKAASYTLWNPSFSTIRTYLLANMTFMLSDSTGVPPQYAKDGFVQETYGRFAGPFLDANKRDADDFRGLWNSQPTRELPFRYGYLDSQRRPHLLVTRRLDSAGDRAGSTHVAGDTP